MKVAYTKKKNDRAMGFPQISVYVMSIRGKLSIKEYGWIANAKLNLTVQIPGLFSFIIIVASLLRGQISKWYLLF